MSRCKIGVGLLGMGTVGRGVYRILMENQALIEQKVGLPVKVKKILVRDVTKDRGFKVEEGLLTDNAGDILDSPDIDVVVEVLGGIRPALDYSLQALKRGKSLVTANKDMIAEHGRELFEAAAANGCDLLFEGSVGGGIPIIRPLKECLAANRIHKIMGIINGTTNYMLTMMSREGLDFQSVLREAQALGYAEADPGADIGGYDAARKLVILASIAFNTRIALDKVYVEGITRITAEDIRYAAELNYVVKLLAIAKESEEGIEVRVHPALLPKNHPLASVNDVYNAIFVSGDAVGDVMFFGRGAGEMPTASAVVADVMNAARNLIKKVPGIISCTCFEEKPVKPMGLTSTKYYIRLKVADKPGVLAGIAFVLGSNEVSLASVIQKHTDGKFAEIVLVTHEVLERNLQDALRIIKELSTVNEISNVIRVEGE
ncbi:MAG: homoserine dehydrogenase [Pelotomaculum sp.]|uniref:Homoserine dehydrogenase n=1 Tax=Pelotomaculum thermopropionicum (strain DSM 13744 / JCM 10971 / SI) TaxID=370438 RepID=A5D1T8_PELTS|nr:homoserine dehydrogenase [Pelotomaculum sp.]BAF59782.1 homoserine dehydrogenase [Pelotomaculum thermopropionicum SI]